MSLLVIGVSHRTAPVSLLERLVLTEDGVDALLADAAASANVAEALVVTTCNRLEVYADVAKYHAGVATLTELIARHTGVDADRLAPHLAMHHGDRAVDHLFALACGLESMVVGEAQILGQVRTALRRSQAAGTAGRLLNDLVQHALRVGKRAHAETGIDRAAPSLVSAGLDIAFDHHAGDLRGRRAVVLGAGSLGRLAGVHLSAAGAELTFVNRTAARAHRLAEEFGGRALPLTELASALADADVVLTCTGALGTLVDRAGLAEARAGRTAPVVLLDLALPRDVDPAVRDLPGVTLVGLEQLAEHSGEPGLAARSDIQDVRAIVAAEVETYLAARREERAYPTVVALRARADAVVRDELARLDARLPGLDPQVREELAVAMRRAVDKLLHQPTVRMKQLAAEPGGDGFAETLGELFDLTLTSVESVTRTGLAGVRS